MALFGCKYPKSALHEFYQVHTGTPTFRVDADLSKPSEPRFECTLTCPGVDTFKGSFPESTFKAVGHSKRGAEHAASLKALEFISSRGLTAPIKQPSPSEGTEALPSGSSAFTSAEGRALQQRLDSLSRQISAGTLPSNSLVVVLPPPGSVEESEEISPSLSSIEGMPESVLQDELTKALKEKARLAAELRKEGIRREAVVKILMGSDELPAAGELQ